MMHKISLAEKRKYGSQKFVNLVDVIVDIESFWTEGYAGQSPNSGH